MLKKVLVISCLLAFVLALAGCNTVHGFGKDMQAGGQALSDVAS